MKNLDLNWSTHLSVLPSWLQSSHEGYIFNKLSCGFLLPAAKIYIIPSPMQMQAWDHACEAQQSEAQDGKYMY